VLNEAYAFEEGKMTQELPEMPKETGELSYKSAQDMPEAIKDLIYREWLPRIMAGALKAVRELPAEHRNHVLKGMSDACGPMAVEVCGIDPNVSKEEYLKYMTELPAPLGPRTIEWINDLIQVEYHPPKGEDGRPICQCPMIQLGMVEPFPELCICAANTGACFVEAYTQKKASGVELMGSIHSGQQSCRYRVHLKPSITSTSR
jgi:hypothetical protein